MLRLSKVSEQMRILAFSDIHRRLSAITNLRNKALRADIVICCGDLADFGHGLRRVCEELRGIHELFLVIPGNNERPEQLKGICEEFGWIYLHGKTFKFGEFSFAGVGGSTTTPFNTPFELSEEEIEGILRPFEKVKNLILISHSPPFKTKVDEFIFGVHVGSKAIREFIEKNQPILNLCGHVHERAGFEDRIGKTRVINTGRDGIIVEI